MLSVSAIVSGPFSGWSELPDENHTAADLVNDRSAFYTLQWTLSPTARLYLEKPLAQHVAAKYVDFEVFGVPGAIWRTV